MYNALENTYRAIVSYGVLALEFVGVAIILYSAIRSICMLFTKNPHSRLALAEGIALALEFKLGGEVLRTTIVRDWSELGILGAIILLRGALTLLLHWEIRHEEIRCGPLPIDRA